MQSVFEGSKADHFLQVSFGRPLVWSVVIASEKGVKKMGGRDEKKKEEKRKITHRQLFVFLVSLCSIGQASEPTASKVRFL